MTWEEKIFSIKNDVEFTTIALEIFRHQATHNKVYARYLNLLGTDIHNIDSLEKIPFLPIEFFKSHRVTTSKAEPQVVFTSSGTTGAKTSHHYISNLKLYEQSFIKGFKFFYGDVTDYCILALLPSYMERKGSSLIYMMKRLIQDSKHPKSGFYLHNLEELVSTLNTLKEQKKKVILLGVSFALLDLAERYRLDLEDIIVMETGGMKGKRNEITREELHSFLSQRLGVSAIHSEYGMTELLSQAYSKGESLFRSPPWMKILIRDTYDPFSYEKQGRSGGINIIDLANTHSCSFIETMDMGRIHPNGSFEVLGRFDHSDIRGCNLLVTDYN